MDDNDPTPDFDWTQIQAIFWALRRTFWSQAMRKFASETLAREIRFNTFLFELDWRRTYAWYGPSIERVAWILHRRRSFIRTTDGVEVPADRCPLWV